MMLRDEGRFALDDPIVDFIPQFADLEIMNDDGSTPAGHGSHHDPASADPHGRPHPALSYDGPLTEHYKANGLEGMRSTGSMTEVIAKLAGMPVGFEPGTRWQYSMAQEVLGRLVEVVSGQSFDRFLHERIFEPLGMADTGFHVPADKIERFCSNYPAPDNGSNPPLDRWNESRFLQPPDFPSGGGGLVSTLDDYLASRACLPRVARINGRRSHSGDALEPFTRRPRHGGNGRDRIQR